MGWVRSSFWIWLSVTLGAGCSGKYESRPHESSASTGGSDSGVHVGGGSDPGAAQAGGEGPVQSPGGSPSYGGTGPTGGEVRVTLNCGTWVRCDDSSRCAAGEDCIALVGCEQGICATPRIVCELNCGSPGCTWPPSGLTEVRLFCPTGQIDGFESSAGSGGYPPGYPGG